MNAQDSTGQGFRAWLWDLTSLIPETRFTHFCFCLAFSRRLGINTPSTLHCFAVLGLCMWETTSEGPVKVTWGHTYAVNKSLYLPPYPSPSCFVDANPNPPPSVIENGGGAFARKRGVDEWWGWGISALRSRERDRRSVSLSGIFWWPKYSPRTRNGSYWSSNLWHLHLWLLCLRIWDTCIRPYLSLSKTDEFVWLHPALYLKQRHPPTFSSFSPCPLTCKGPLHKYFCLSLNLLPCDEFVLV